MSVLQLFLFLNGYNTIIQQFCKKYAFVWTLDLCDRYRYEQAVFCIRFTIASHKTGGGRPRFSTWPWVCRGDQRWPILVKNWPPKFLTFYSSFESSWWVKNCYVIFFGGFWTFTQTIPNQSGQKIHFLKKFFALQTYYTFLESSHRDLQENI